MPVVYNTILTALHMLGTYIFAGLCFGKYVFVLTWTKEEEIDFILCGLVVFAIHYGLLFLGHKTRVLRQGIVRWLQIWERILFIPQIVFVVYIFLGNVIERPMVVIKQELPTVFLLCSIYIAIGFVRNLSNKYIIVKKSDNNDMGLLTTDTKDKTEE